LQANQVHLGHTVLVKNSSTRGDHVARARIVNFSNRKVVFLFSCCCLFLTLMNVFQEFIVFLTQMLTKILCLGTIMEFLAQQTCNLEVLGSMSDSAIHAYCLGHTLPAIL